MAVELEVGEGEGGGGGNASEWMERAVGNSSSSFRIYSFMKVSAALEKVLEKNCRDSRSSEDNARTSPPPCWITREVRTSWRCC